ncbi:unconventional myosin-Va-like isoform X3 [Macrobrachium nipponense]|uniref:unconventional myosin-Va-like isoform X3 n=1 Tax=Macrobrachium nipponense TaxID=159736 RepID=UPI0030C82001
MPMVIPEVSAYTGPKNARKLSLDPLAERYKLIGTHFWPRFHLHHYVTGARVWIPDPEQVWRFAELTKDYKDNVVAVIYEDAQGIQRTEEFKVKSDEDLPPLRNPDILLGENDLTSLSYLHEPAVLYNLQVRFCNHNAIYTYCGIVLVAINPYDELPIYGPDTISAYRGHNMGDLDPHIFAVAEEAFTQMERENKDQSIIVSGESGAGKTVSAKYAMRYFASVGGAADSETHVEKKILASNPIMEAIGNAKTTRNDNSSRFGKYIELDFTQNYSILGANMRTYLLEKSRVVFQAPDERNYHIFYQLCAVASEEKLKHLRLGAPETFHYLNQGLQAVPRVTPRKKRKGHQDNFHYLNQGFSPHIDGVDDGADFHETCQAFNLLGIHEKSQDQIYRILAGILHLGNVTVEESGTDSSSISKGDEALQIASDLFGVDVDDLRKWLCHRKIVSGREVFNKPMTVTEATFSRDALSKHIYAKLFDWIVSEINKCFAAKTRPYRFIGVLDIYGFETFEINSFEQFCINYANEKLQQQFNQHVFKLEQEEYVKEQIEWEFINFYDNQPCIDLIESKLGILDLLDEECRMPKGSDQSWVEKLYDKCKKWDHFSKPRLSNTSFVIAHFADKVGYECAGFLEKNRDTVSEECVNILKSSQYPLVRALFTEKAKGAQTKVKVMPAGPAKSKDMRKSVGSQFRESLSLLMTTLNSTTPHYVRCIKPNDDKMAFTFDPTRAIQQLRACGVLETVRISAAGYPSRWTYNEFLCRYRVLCNSRDIQRNDVRVTCQKIISNMISDEDKFKFGRTKIFFRAGQVAYMEKLRADRLCACGVMIQKNVRMFIVRKRYRTMRSAALTIQRYSRGMVARRRVHHMRQTAAAIKIQACMRGWLKRVRYQRLKYTVIRLQSRARGTWARQRFEHMRRVRACIVIQKHIRKYLAVKHFRMAVRGFITLQGLVRCFLARRMLKKLKIEAKSIEHQKKLNKGLENKIISLQQKLTEMKHENNNIKAYKEEITTLKSQVVEMKALENQLKGSTNRVTELEALVTKLTGEVEFERGEKMDILTQKEQAEKDNRELVERLNTENARLTEELNEAQKEEVMRQGEELLRRKFEAEKQQIIMESSEEKAAYQRLLAEYNRLEQKNDILEEQLAKVKGGSHKRSASNVSNSGASDTPTELVRDDIMDLNSMMGDEDVGYGSVRSRMSENSDSSRNLENIEWESPQKIPNADIKIQVPEKVEDITLILQLQNKVRELEKERRTMARRVDQLETSSSPLDDSQHAQELIRLQELEMENAKLKDDLNRLRKSIADSEPQNNQVQEFMKQFEALQDELERRREECIQLRTVLANRSHDIRSLTENSYGKDVDIVNEDGELAVAYQTQKQVNRQLEEELKTEKMRHKETESEYKSELERLRRDNERQQKLLSQNLSKGGGSHPEALLQSEIMRLTSENLNLQGQVDSLTEQLKKYKRTLKAYAKKLKETSGTDPSDLLDVTNNETDVMPVIRKKEREYMGMFEYDRSDEMQIIRVLIYELKPRVAVTFLPGLPAYILFMCIRHTDHINDDEKVRSLLNNIVNGVKRVIKKRHEDLDSTVLWLSNTLRLLHNLKQYSGDKAFQAENTVKQNEQSLKNFDLSEYRQVLSDIAVWIYNGVIKLMEEKVQPLIVPSILEHEAIAGLSGNKPGGMRGRAGSVARELESPVEPQKALDLLLKEMTQFYRTLAMFGTDPELITQVFRQIFYFICAGSLNNLLLRKDMCHWSKGMQIRYNLSHLEQWTRDMRLHESGVTDTLAPIIQAAQLLQARKTDDDVHSICDMCDKLSVSQIIKILNLYTPADEFEERVPISFIHKIQTKLQERAEGEQAQATLLMNTKFAFPVRFPFNPSSIHLEDIELPDSLNLSMLKKV